MTKTKHQKENCQTMRTKRLDECLERRVGSADDTELLINDRHGLVAIFDGRHPRRRRRRLPPFVAFLFLFNRSDSAAARSILFAPSSRFNKTDC
jgi:hypothetical protein